MPLAGTRSGSCSHGLDEAGGGRLLRPYACRPPFYRTKRERSTPCKSAPHGAISSPTAEAGFGANIGAQELAAWADRVGAPAHTPEAQRNQTHCGERTGSPTGLRPRQPGILGFPHATHRPAVRTRGSTASPTLRPCEARGRIREAIAMQRAYEDDNGTPTDRATFNLQRRHAAGRSHQRAGHEPARERRLQAGQPAL